MSSSISRVILFLAVVLATCIYMTTAAPIVQNELTAQLELAHVSVPHINVFKKHQEDEDYEESTTTTTTATATATTKASKHSKTTSTEIEEPTTTTTTKSTKTSKTTKTTTTDEPTETAKASKSKSSGSSSGSHSGDATYYDAGLGSCGQVSENSDMIVALNHGQMANGANPNNNELCGKTITAHGPKGSVTVKIVDTCPGCANGDLDLSPAAFSKIADMAQGRVPITWDFN